MECVRRFAEVDDLTHLIEDCEKMIENAKHARDLMENRINVIQGKIIYGKDLLI